MSGLLSCDQSLADGLDPIYGCAHVDDIVFFDSGIDVRDDCPACPRQGYGEAIDTLNQLMEFTAPPWGGNDELVNFYLAVPSRKNRANIFMIKQFFDPLRAPGTGADQLVPESFMHRSPASIIVPDEDVWNIEKGASDVGNNRVDEIVVRNSRQPVHMLDSGPVKNIPV
jgi:hypothetical protein